MPLRWIRMSWLQNIRSRIATFQIVVVGMMDEYELVEGNKIGRLS